MGKITKQQVIRSIFKLYILLLFIYFVVYIANPIKTMSGLSSDVGSRTSVILVSLFIVLIGFGYWIVNFRQNWNVRFFRPFYWFIIYVLLSFVFYSVADEVDFSLISPLSKILVWILPLSLFYISYRIIGLREVVKYLQIVTLAYILFMGIMSFQSYNNMDIQMTEGGVFAGADIFTVLPLLFAVFKPRWRFWLYFLCFAIAVVTSKRTPIIILLLATPLLFKDCIKNLKVKDWVLFGLLSMSFIISFLSTFWNRMIERNEIDLEGDSYGSGRTVFQKIAIEGWWNNDLFSFLFGAGEGQVNNYLKYHYGMKIGSHNGFIDILFNYGLLGASIYMAIFYHLWKYRKFIKDNVPQFYPVYLLFIVIWIAQNILAHGYAGINLLMYSFFISYIYYLAYNNYSKRI